MDNVLFGNYSVKYNNSMLNDKTDDYSNNYHCLSFYDTIVGVVIFRHLR